MNTEKIAILVDSCTDVPKEYIDKYKMYTIPLMICYSDGEFRDGIDINAGEVYERFSTEIPKTSLPSIEVIKDTYKQIISDGYEKVIAISISSGLSGTFNAVNMAARSFDQIKNYVIDTKNIGVGAGFTAILAGQLLEKRFSFNEIIRKLEENVNNTKIFFCVNTLEYLRKGGRIGLVSGTIGTVLDLKPIITCNDAGIYTTVTMARGRKQSLKKAISCAAKYGGKFEKCNIAIANGGAQEEAAEIVKIMNEKFPYADITLEGHISPALVVHTGPGLIGIGIQKNII